MSGPGHFFLCRVPPSVRADETRCDERLGRIHSNARQIGSMPEPSRCRCGDRVPAGGGAGRVACSHGPGQSDVGLASSPRGPSLFHTPLSCVESKYTTPLIASVGSIRNILPLPAGPPCVDLAPYRPKEVPFHLAWRAVSHLRLSARPASDTGAP